ncbi:LytR C-terminal domain-containing protein [Trueperella sp. LYQ143]|uniref:LytR C-terminal domain-containing protein n=1 Tax=Trueperella sp. LYQ143 TaxID=3391059 RepID=UPI003983CB19
MNSNARAEYRKRTQQRQTVIFGSMVLIMAALLILGSLVWLNVIPFPFNRDFSRAPDTSQVVCPTDANATPSPTNEITVSVYNATETTGLAKSVAESLGSIGIKVRETGNWSTENFSEAVRIYTSPEGINDAYTMRAYFDSSSVHIDPNIADKSVSIVLGSHYQNVNLKPTPEQITAAMHADGDCVDVSDFTD